MLPADRALQEMSGKLRDAQRRIERLETLEHGTAGAIACSQFIQTAEGESEVTFSAIDQNFLHLWLWMSVHSTNPDLGCAMLMTFNGDTGTNYLSYNIGHLRDGGGTDTDAIVASTSSVAAIRIGHSGPENHHTGCEVNLYNYALFEGINARRPVTWKSWDFQFGPSESSNLIGVRQGGGRWINTADPITSITISAGGGFCEFGNSSLFSLIGLCPI